MALVLQVKGHERPGRPLPVLRQYRLDPMYDSLEFVWNIIETVLAELRSDEDQRVVSFLLDTGHQADVLLSHHMTISVIDERVARRARRES